MKNIDWKKILPHVAAIATFVVLTAIYFYPVFEGKMVKMEDMDRYRGMAMESRLVEDLEGTYPLWTNSIFSGMPTYQIGKVGGMQGLERVDRLFWLGFPRFAGYFLIGLLAFYFLSRVLKMKPILGIAMSIAYGFSSYFVIIIQAGHVSKLHAAAYIPAVIAALILVYRNKNLILGGTLFALFLGLQIMSNHLQITYYMFFILLGFVLFYLFKQVFLEKDFRFFLKGSVVLLLSTFLAIMANFGNIAYTYGYGQKTTRGPSELTINPENPEETIKKENGLDFEYITNWSYGKDETFSLFIPSIKGGSSGSAITSQEEFNQLDDQQLKMYIANYGLNQYWGTQPFTSGPVYVGALIFALFVLGMVFIKSQLKWWVLGVTLLAILLSWGKNLPSLTLLFMDFFPGYNKFRAVTMILVIVQFTLPFIALLYLKELFEKRDVHVKKMKAFFITSGSILGILLLFIAIPSAFFDFITERESMQLNNLGMNNQAGFDINTLKSSITDFRISVFREDVLRSLGFIIVGLALIFLFLKKKIQPFALGISLTFLITLDLILVDKRYLHNEKDQKGEYVHWVDRDRFEFPRGASKADYAIFEREKNEQTNKLYQSFVEIAQSENNGEPVYSNQLAAYQFGALNLTTNYRVLKLGDPFNDSFTSLFHKNVGGYHGAKLKRYQQLISMYISKEQQQFIQGLSTVKSMEDLEQLTAQLKVMNMLNAKYLILDAEQLVPNPNANGNAWYIEEIVWAETPDEELLKLNEIDPKNQVLVPSKYKQDISSTSFSIGADTIYMTSYHPEKIEYQAVNQNENYAVFSEVYFEDGWKAFIDGQEVKHHQVDFVLRGLLIPSGEHTITFKFEPESYTTITGINMAFSWLVVILALLGIGLEIKRKNQGLSKKEIDE